MMQSQRIFLGCEFTGILRDAFLRQVHDAWLCDLLPAEQSSNRHTKGDGRDILGDGWDLLVVTHPLCTRFCPSGRRWLSGLDDMMPPKQLPVGRTWQSMKDEFDAGLELFITYWRTPIDHVSIENSGMHDLVRARMPADVPRPTVVQPFRFGHHEYKATGWYLGQPALEETERLAERKPGSDEWKAWNRVWRMQSGKNQSHERSRFSPKMNDAMAEQWGRRALAEFREAAE